MPNYRNCFPDYDDTLPKLEGFFDSSYKNDSCPSLSDDADPDPENCIYIFCDYKEPTRREGGETSPRFRVLNGYATGNYIFDSNNWGEVVQFIKELKK